MIWPYITLHVMFLLGLLRMIFVLRQNPCFDFYFYFDNLDITRIRAPFSSRKRWLSFFRCSSCFNSSSISHSFFSKAFFSFFSVSVRPPELATLRASSNFFLEETSSLRTLLRSSDNRVFAC